VITCSNKNCVVVSALQYFTGDAYAHLVKYYVTVIIYLALDLFVGGLIGPTKSISHLSNTCKVTCGLRGISVGHHSLAHNTFCAVDFPA
jgi:hypothetical protein